MRRLLLLLAALAAATPADAQRVSIIWSGDSDAGVSADVNARRAALEEMGFSTRIDNPNNSQSWYDTYGVTTLYDALYVSAEADVDALADKLRAHQTPVLYETPEMDDNFGVSTSAGTTLSGTQITIDTLAHPITATSFLGNANIYTANNPIAQIQGTPAASLTALASSGGQAVLGAIETGGALANTINSNSTAAARRVRLPFGGSGVNWSETTGTTDNLLEQSVVWATGLTYSPSGTSGVCVMLTTDNGVLTDEETWRVRFLAYSGWTVVLLWDGDSQANYDAALAAADVVWVTADADDGDVGDKLRESTVGVVYAKPEMDDNFGLSDSPGFTSNTTGYTVEDRTHPITANFLNNQFCTCFQRFDYDANNWPGINQAFGRMQGTLASDARVIGSGWDDPVLVTVDTGDTLANSVGTNSTATARRVRLPWATGADISYVRSWSRGNQTLYNALRWASGTQTGTLVAHYKLDETSGTTAADSSGNGYDGSYSGGVTQNITPAPRSVAANFDANGENVLVASNTDLENLGAGNADYSVAFWIRMHALSHSTWRSLLHVGGAASTDRAPLIMIHPTLRRPYIWHSTTAISSGTGGYSAGIVDEEEWTHLAVVKSGEYARWYMDGEFQNVVTVSGEALATAGELRIGRGSWWGSPDADLDDVRVYSYGLSDQEIAELYSTLVLHLKFDETSGTVAEDSSVFGNDGTYTGSPTVGVEGALNQATDFDGATSYLRVPAAGHLDMTTTLTITAWVNVDDFDNADGIFSRGDDDEQAYALRLRADGKIQWRSNRGFSSPGTSPVSQTFESTGSLTAGKWSHVAATWDGANVRFYFDGVLDSTHALAGTIGVTSEDSAIGSDIVDADEWFDGRIDDLRVYNRALTDAEVYELGGNGLRLHLKLDETLGTVAEDSSPFGNDASFSSGGLSSVEGVIGNGFRFDGVDDVIATDAVFDPPATGAVAFWMRRDADPTGTERLFGLGGDWEVRQSSDGTITFDLGESPYTGYDDFRTLTPVGDDARWVHVAANFDATDESYEIYLNGELHRSAVHTRDLVQQTAAVLSVGARTGSSDLFAGELDDLRIYGRELTAAEVSDLYGLIGHWKLDEISGATVVQDETPFDNDGEYINLPALEEESPYPSDAVRTAVRFEPGDYVSVPNDDHLEVGHQDADFSVAYWLKSNRDYDGQWREVTKKHTNGYERTFAMWLRPSDERMHFRISTDHSWNEGADSIAEFTPDVWRHVAYVKQGSQLLLYVDGVIDRTVNLQGASYANNGDLYFGIRGSSVRSDVTIDDYRVYSRALNDWEVAELHGLVGWYRMEDLSGSVVTDSSGIENHAVVVGTTPGWPLDAQEGTSSIELDGTNYIEAPRLPVDGPGAAISGWARLDATDTGGSELVSLGDHLAIRLDTDWGDGSIAFGYNGASWERTPAGPNVKDSGWRHFAASYRDDLRELSLYLDGVLVDVQTMTTDLVLEGLGSGVVIGHHGSGQTPWNFTGRIDDVRVYNRPISRAEARALYYGAAVPGLRIVRWVEVANP